jgi:hypothetical protein
MIPHGERMRFPGIGDGDSETASGLTVSPTRAFLDRWFP